MDKAPVQLDGPASRAPERSFNDDAGDASEDDASDSSTAASDENAASEPTAATRPQKRQRCSSMNDADTPSASLPTTCTGTLEDLDDGVAVSSIAVDPVHHLQPVQMMQALQGQIELMHEQAAAIAKNELKGKVADADGVLQPVADEGGRYQMRNIVLDVQQIAKDSGREGAMKVEKAAIGAAACRLLSAGSKCCRASVRRYNDEASGRTSKASLKRLWRNSWLPTSSPPATSPWGRQQREQTCLQK